MGSVWAGVGACRANAEQCGRRIALAFARHAPTPAQTDPPEAAVSVVIITLLRIVSTLKCCLSEPGSAGEDAAGGDGRKTQFGLTPQRLATGLARFMRLFLAQPGDARHAGPRRLRTPDTKVMFSVFYTDGRTAYVRVDREAAIQRATCLS